MSAELLDLAGIAKLLKVRHKTPNTWRQRGLLPPVDFPGIRTPLWKRATIVKWALVSGRLTGELAAELRAKQETGRTSSLSQGGDDQVPSEVLAAPDVDPTLLDPDLDEVETFEEE